MYRYVQCSPGTLNEKSTKKIYVMLWSRGTGKTIIEHRTLKTLNKQHRQNNKFCLNKQQNILNYGKG